MTTTTEIPTTIDLAPLIGLRPNAEQLVEQLVTGQAPADTEIDEFLSEARRHGAQVVDTILLNLGDGLRDHLGSTWANSITDELQTVVDLLTGAHSVAVTWDQYATPERAAQRAATLYARLVGAGALDEHSAAWILSDDGIEEDGGVWVRHRLADDVVIARHGSGVEVEHPVVRDEQ